MPNALKNFDFSNDTLDICLIRYALLLKNLDCDKLPA